jgi:hypothetical protein
MVDKIETWKHALRVASDKIVRKHIADPLCSYEDAKGLFWESFKLIAEKRNFKPEPTKGQQKVLPLLTAYFSGNIVNEDSLDLSKGIFLYGGCGTGKSFLFEVMRFALRPTNYHAFFDWASVPAIYDRALAKNINFSSWYHGNKLFDDLGFSRGDIKHFGNEINPMQTIFTHRYEQFTRTGQITHVTSNLAPKAFEGRMDERIMSRLPEMFNLIELSGEDLRKTTT